MTAPLADQRRDAGAREYAAASSSLLTAQACVVASLALGLVKITDGEVRVQRGAWRHAGSAGIVLALAFIGLTEGLARAQASVVVPIAKEPFSRRTALGLAAAIMLLTPG